MDRCPVCHGKVDEEEAMSNSNTVYYFGRLYLLKHRECKGAFLRDPERYAGRQQGAEPGRRAA